MKLNYNFEYYNNTKDWLKSRIGSFGGSSVSALLRCNPYTDPIDIYCSALNPSDEISEKETPSTKYGHDAEPLLAKLFALNFPQYEVDYLENGKIRMARRKDRKILAYTPDALLKEIATGRLGFLEIKTHIVKDQEDYDMWANNQLPQNYYCQELQGFVVMNDREFCELYVILNWIDYETNSLYKSELRHYHLERENCKDDIKLLEKIEIDFQENNIEKRCPPDIVIKL